MSTGSDHPLHRIEVRTAPGMPDPRADSVRRKADAQGLHLAAAASAKVYFIQGR